MRRAIHKITAIAAAVLLLALPAAALAAQKTTDEPAVTSTAYYWQDAKKEEHQTPQGTVTVETPPPFCPATLPGSLGSAEELCASGVLPVWIRQGDYEKPYMLSAVGFDLSLVPVGSKVLEFKVTFLEDESDCTDHDDKPETAPRCRSTDPINIEDKKLQACMLGQIVGGGDARPYDEVPGYRCSNADPVAKRKEIPNNEKQDPDDQTPDHVWTFDLTPFARQWTKQFTVATGIMLTAKAPQKTGENNDNWRVVLAGSEIENGVRTKLIFIPSEEAIAPIVPPSGTPGLGGTGFAPPTGGSGFSTSTGGSFGDMGSSSVGAPTGEAAPGEEQPLEAAPVQPAAEQIAVESMPGYVWAAILGGLIAFSLVRSVILENATGIRPNGALAQIRKLNAARRGAAIEELSGSRLSGIAATLSSFSSRASAPVAGAAKKLGSLIRRS